MRSKNIVLFFLAILTITLIVLLTISYNFFQQEKTTLRKTIENYRTNSARLITERVHQDLILDNQMEAIRKLTLLKDENVINAFEIRKGSNIVNTLEDCETIYFDRKNGGTPWGKLCLSFSEQFKSSGLINLKHFSTLFLILVCFILLLVVFIFKKIANLNKALFENIAALIKSPEKTISTKNFWSPILNELTRHIKALKEAETKLTLQQIEHEKIELANQVAHDIRSPISALENIEFIKRDQSPEGKIAKSSLNRLKKIAEELLNVNRSVKYEHLEVIDLVPIIKNLINVKQVENPTYKCDFYHEIELALCNLNPTNFESILSNLINNAQEAYAKNISIKIKTHLGKYEVTIEDDGIGISAELVEKLGDEKITFGKDNGNGIGLFSAKKIINSWLGTLEVESLIGRGTIITISLPCINHSLSVVLVDDDDLTRVTWSEKAKKANISFYCFKNSKELLNALDNIPQSSSFYIDANLGNENGEHVLFNLKELGFENLYMCTGYPPENYKHITFLKGIIGKIPPF